VRLRGGRCSACGVDTSSTVLWCGRALLRLWCCDLCAALLNEDVRAQLTCAAAELEAAAAAAPPELPGSDGPEREHVQAHPRHA